MDLTKAFFFSILVVFACAFNLIAQVECDYIPLNFEEELSYQWSHVIIDSSIIGHVDTSNASGQFQQYYPDGMEHLRSDAASFVSENHLYSIIQTRYDEELSGVYVEKIDINTGTKLWDIKTDLRFVDHREKVLEAYLENDLFIMKGVRTIMPEIEITSGLESGQLPTYFFKRVYDDNTGELLEYASPENNDENAAILNTVFGSNYIIPQEDSTYSYFNINSSITRGVFLERMIFDSNGLSNGIIDTVVSNTYDGLDLSRTTLVAGNYLLKEENSFYYIEQVIPKADSDESLKSKITKYDNQFNPIDSLDLTEVGVDVFSRLTLIGFFDDRLLIHGCSQASLNFKCTNFFILLDENLNVLEVNNGTFNGEFPDFYYLDGIQQTNNGRLIFIDRNIVEDGQSFMNIYALNNSGNLDLLKRLVITEANRVATVDRLIILDNGDLLIKYIRYCREDEDNSTWTHEWFRYDASNFDFSTTTNEESYAQNDIALYPNPSSDILFLDSQSPITGEVSIFNLEGKQLIHRKIENQKLISIDIEPLQENFYVIQLVTSEGLVMNKKFIKI